MVDDVGQRHAHPGDHHRPRLYTAKAVDAFFQRQLADQPIDVVGLRLLDEADRKSVVWGKSVSVRVDLGGRRIIKNNRTTPTANSAKPNLYKQTQREQRR